MKSGRDDLRGQIGGDRDERSEGGKRVVDEGRERWAHFGSFDGPFQIELPASDLVFR